MTPEQEEQVRRALAGLAGAAPDPGLAGAAPDAGPPGAAPDPVDRPADPPLPPEVAARLDAVLADLVEPRRLAADRAHREARVAASGRDLTARREAAARRARRRNLLLAAASVAAITVAGYAVVAGGSGGGSSSDSSSAGSAASAASAASGTDSQDSGSGSRSGALDPSAVAGRTAGPGRSVLPPDDPDAPRLHAATLRRDVGAFLASSAAVDPDRTSTGPDAGGPSEPRTRLGCLRPQLGAGERLVAVRLDGRRATLVLGRPADAADDQVLEARVYSCATSGRPVTSVTVPTR